MLPAILSPLSNDRRQLLHTDYRDYPYYNGIIATKWLDRETLQPVFCVDDANYYASPKRLKTSTISDELKINSNGTALVYSFASDRESAILSAGHAGDGAYWLDHSGKMDRLHLLWYCSARLVKVFIIATNVKHQ
jgi:hypothetical protein